MLTIVHGVYKRNPHIEETLKLNLLALNQAGVKDFQYIVFNDKGDKEIYDDLKHYHDKIEYIYSPINFGKKVCRGSWVGAIPYIKKDIVHVTDQDDVMTSAFYRTSLKVLNQNPDIDLVFSSCFHASEENLEIMAFGTNPEINPGVNFPSYENNPFDCFKLWFGVGENGKDEVTRANNFMMASGVIYRTKLHNIVGEPDLEFGGACDFEYWARILFNERKCKMINLPTWLYRKAVDGKASKYSAANEIIDGKNNNDYHRQQCLENIEKKYYNLYKEKVNGIRK